MPVRPLLLTLLIGLGAAAADDRAPRTPIPFAQVESILARHPSDAPAELRGRSRGARETRWSAWMRRHEADVRARLDRGDLDTVVNLWMYGTTFTRQPRVTAAEAARLGPTEGEALLLRRLEDLVASLAEPGADERLRLARDVVERHGARPSTPEGRQRAMVLLATARNDMVAETRRYRAQLQSTAPNADVRLHAYATLYRERGLSSDTSAGVGFAVESALSALARRGTLRPGSVRRVAVVGPGLDVLDKAEGHDVSPPQTLQPFTVVDSLVRLGLADLRSLHVTTFDVNGRVNRHLEDAVSRAKGGTAYVIHLPLDRRAPARAWNPDLVRWWTRAGEAIGEPDGAVRSPADASVDVRAIHVRPLVVTRIAARELNVVLERLTLSDAERFDLVVTTNVLVYYSRFEQALASANIASMLRPGGLVLTNSPLPFKPFDAAPAFVTPVVFDEQQNGDTIFTYANP